MPNIKSAKKRAKQNEKRRVRNYAVRSKVRSHIKTFEEYVKEKKQKEAEAALQRAYSVIDTAVKKNIMHKNTAARRKSKLAKAMNGLVVGGGEKKAVTKKKAPAKKASAEKAKKEDAKA